VATGKWARLLATPLTDGQGKRNAYCTPPLLGPDGFFHIWAGKTTLLRLISGSLSPESGHVALDQLPVDQVNPAALAASIGYKPQDAALFTGSIEDNIHAGRPMLSATDRAELLLHSGLATSFATQGLHWATAVGARGSALSGGQRQMVALARALYGNPAVLLLDEPTTGLDMEHEKHVVKQLAARKGSATILISTHSHALLSICDRIIVIGGGKLLANGPREKILL
jgi:ABC-type bacteriocin/lantibiotic exporter with double-glycine peptidase domain